MVILNNSKMINKICIILLSVLILLQISCTYYDFSKNDMDLIDVKIYDEKNNEIVGEYKNYYREIISPIKGSYDYEILPLNSAAPVYNLYCIDAKVDKTYTIKLYFYSKKSYEISKISLRCMNTENEDTYNIDCDNIEKEEDYFVATIKVDKVEKTNQIYWIENWFNKNVKYTFGSKGSNNYIKGVYFDLPESNNLLS